MLLIHAVSLGENAGSESGCGGVKRCHALHKNNCHKPDDSKYSRGHIQGVIVLLNKATSECSFANSSRIFTIFGILVNNDIVDKSHDLVA